MNIPKLKPTALSSRRPIRVLLIWAMMLAGCARVSRGAEPELAKNAFFVTPTGDDRNAGSSQNPWRTIQHAVDAAVPGVTIYVRAGTYDEQILIAKSGVAGQYINIENYPGERPVIDSRFTKNYGFNTSSGNYIRIKGFEIRNCAANAVSPGSEIFSGRTPNPAE